MSRKAQKFKGIFRPKLGDLQKKRSSPKLRLIFRPISQIHSFWEGGAVFVWGGLFSIFHRKSASKTQKTCDFAYFTSQWGGLEAPPPPWLPYWLFVMVAVVPRKQTWITPLFDTFLLLADVVLQSSKLCNVTLCHCKKAWVLCYQLHYLFSLFCDFARFSASFVVTLLVSLAYLSGRVNLNIFL